MKKVMVFFNHEPVVALSVMSGVSTIRRSYPNGEGVSLKIMSVSVSEPGFEQKIVHVASDRELSYDEIKNAVKKHL
ncbi:hypothetical protein A9B99_18270 [Mangrovibacter phragmitis]|uniref:Uncharacterized protein n=1 Tax=Mangrovibacter phragmitis TaxID=1691903 RepID=A0A1B7L7B9_9ENTR|nr:hypothetical protein [Mangrovibacter phragmitis]OAT78091.1 hypothetical protein A9B99_18270 [Mangrovibacter phragmitis]